MFKYGVCSAFDRPRFFIIIFIIIIKTESFSEGLTEQVISGVTFQTFSLIRYLGQTVH
jgi:hypothetical protein